MARVVFEYEYQWGPVLCGRLRGEVASVEISGYPSAAEITHAKRAIHRRLLAKLSSQSNKEVNDRGL